MVSVSATVTGATKATFVEPVIDPACAVIVAVSIFVDDCSVIVAIPPAPVITPVTSWPVQGSVPTVQIEPALVVKSTDMPSKGVPPADTNAVIDVWLLPAATASMVSDAAVTSIESRPGIITPIVKVQPRTAPAIVESVVQVPSGRVYKALEPVITIVSIVGTLKVPAV